MAMKRTRKLPISRERNRPRSRSDNGLRNKILTEACYGKIDPEQAEARAAAAELEPFEQSPEFTAFDPMAQSRWPMVMAIAWIAWRACQLVMEQGANSPAVLDTGYSASGMSLLKAGNALQGGQAGF